jgi:hypothetical protein
MREKVTPMKWLCLLAVFASVLMAQAPIGTSTQWEQPAAALAEQIAAILGPGQAHLVIRNNSQTPTDEIPAIRRLLEQDLKARGIQASGAESADVIRVTLSENLRERLWVAEIVEGNETRLAMVRVEPAFLQQQASISGITLRKQAVFTTSQPVIAALQTADNLVVIEPEEIVILAHSPDDWKEQTRVGIGQKRPLPRDPRAVVFPSSDGEGFEAWVAGIPARGRLSRPSTGPFDAAKATIPGF